MKLQFKCEKCERYYNTEDECNTCENSHTIIKPKLFWAIPFVGVFMTFYKITTSKNGLVQFGTDFKGELLRSWVFLSPPIMLLLMLLLMELLK